MFSGKTLINLGYQPAKWFGQAITFLNANPKLDYREVKDYLDNLANSQTVYIEPFDTPAPYNINLEAHTDFEIDNLSKVKATMDEVMKTPTVVSGAVMPDACPAGAIGQIPVGGVVVAHKAIHPGMHSADICCSMFHSNFGGQFTPKQVLDAAQSVTHFGQGGRQDFKLVHSYLDDVYLDIIEDMKLNKYLNSGKAQSFAHTHLGTQGDGNHFLYIGTVKTKFGQSVRMVTHHGSRGLGAYLYKEGMKVAEKYRKELSPHTLPQNAWIPSDTVDGEEYWAALQIVRRWTKLNHLSIHAATLAKLHGSDKQAFYDDFFMWVANPHLQYWNEHNFVFQHEDNFYHAKGATPMLDIFVPDSLNGLRLIPLNMSQPIIVAIASSNLDNGLGFAPHGAGRNVSRSQHQKMLEGLTEDQILAQECDGLDIRSFSGKLDTSELPSAYKNAQTVQAQIGQFELANVVELIQPYGCIMAGQGEPKPWELKKMQK